MTLDLVYKFGIRLDSVTAEDTACPYKYCSSHKWSEVTSKNKQTFLLTYQIREHALFATSFTDMSINTITLSTY